MLELKEIVTIDHRHCLVVYLSVDDEERGGKVVEVGAGLRPWGVGKVEH
jgi:hypothetical protein